LIPFIFDAAQAFPPNSRESQAARLIGEWNQMRTDDNGDGFFDHPGQTIFDAWLPIMVRNTLGETLDGFELKQIWLNAGYQTRNPRLEEHPSAGTLVLYYALRNSRSLTGVPHHHDLFGDTSPDKVVRQSLSEAVAAAAKVFRTPMEQWLTPAVEQVFFDTNANRIPMTSPGLSFRLPLYANRGAMNFMAAYGEDQDSPLVRYVNPPGIQGRLAPGERAEDNPLLTNHLEAYQNHELLRTYLNREMVEANSLDGQVIRLDIPGDRPKL